MALMRLIRHRLSLTHQWHHIPIRLTLNPFQNLLFEFTTVYCARHVNLRILRLQNTVFSNSKYYNALSRFLSSVVVVFDILLLNWQFFTVNKIVLEIYAEC